MEHSYGFIFDRFEPIRDPDQDNQMTLKVVMFKCVLYINYYIHDTEIKHYLLLFQFMQFWHISMFTSC